MSRRSLWPAAALVGAVFTLQAQEPAKKARPVAVEPLRSEALTAPVKQGLLQIDATLKGVFESAKMAELALRPEAWLPHSGGGPLTVVSAVAAGVRVKKGETLLTIDTVALDRAIRDLEVEQQGAVLAVQQAEKDLPLLERSIPQETAAAERARTVAAQDLKKFLDQEKSLAERSARFQLQDSQFWLEYARDELRQLEKMYRANDLTEESEQIILKRTRRQVDSAVFYLEIAKYHHDVTLQLEIPRKETALREAAARTALALDKAATLPLTLVQKRQALDKARYDHAKAAEKLQRLRKDREGMTVLAPADGLVYYGKCVQGHWSTASDMAKKLQPGGVLAAEEVFVTVVQPQPLFVRAVVEEKDLPLVAVGAAARVTALVLPGRKLAAKVEQVSAVPLPSGTFEARLAVNPGAKGEKLMPGMTCTVKIVAYRKADALTVPEAAVFEDDANEDRSCVYVAGAGDKPEKRVVEVGHRSAQAVEIVAGVRAGERVLLTRP